MEVTESETHYWLSEGTKEQLVFEVVHIDQTQKYRSRVLMIYEVMTLADGLFYISFLGF